MDTAALDLPDAIARYLITLATQQRDLAYLQISPDGHLLNSGGVLTQYSLDTVKVGDAVEEHLVFLAGFFPHPPENEVIQYIQTEQGKVINVHFITDDCRQTTDSQPHLTSQPTTQQEQWILLLDAAAEIKKEQQFQQIANDLTLVRQRLTKQINQAHHQSASLSTQATSTFTTPPNRTQKTDSTLDKQISVLIIRVCQSSLTLTQLNEYFAEMTQLVSDANGLIHHIFGPTAVALFGLVPTSLSPSVQAARVAKRLLSPLMPQLQPTPASDTTTATTESTHYPIHHPHPIEISITTGDATIGTINHANKQTLNVDGPVISTAFVMRNSTLEGNCNNRFPHSLVVDDLTLQNCHTEFSTFSTHQLHCDHPPPLYQLIPK